MEMETKQKLKNQEKKKIKKNDSITIYGIKCI